MMRAPSLILAFSLTACAAPPAPAPAPREVILVAQPTTAPSASTRRATPTVPQQTLCAERSPCEVLRITPVAREVDGRVSVVLLRGEQQLHHDQASVSVDFETEGGTDTFPASQGGCQVFEYWRVVDGPARSRQLLARICNDGHGASSVGEDVVTLDHGTFQRSTHGGSSWRWGHAVSLTIAPLRVVSTTRSGSWTFGDNSWTEEVAFSPLLASARWQAPRCDAQGEPTSTALDGDGRAIPMLDLDASYLEHGWRFTRLGVCSLAIPGNTSSLAAVSSGDHVFVEVVDDARPLGGRVRDELVVSYTDASPPGATGCVETAPPKHLSADLTRAGLTQTKDVTIEVVPASAADAPAFAKITLPPGTWAVTVALHDTDDGKRHREVVATSALDRTDPATLGRRVLVPSAHARCDLIAGLLQPVPGAPRPEDDLTGL